jgi:two-component system response regulator MtrA
MFNAKTILIVDDEPAVRALLRAALEPLRARLVEAGDGSEALEAAWRERPDVALVDVGLPRLSGIDVCRALKTNPSAPAVLLITGNVHATELASCGADGVIGKPFRPAEVLALVERLLTGVPVA